MKKLLITVVLCFILSYNICWSQAVEKQREGVGLFWGYMGDFSSNSPFDLVKSFTDVNGAGVFLRREINPEIFYQLGLGFYSLKEGEARLSYIYPGSLNYKFLPGKMISPFIGAGLHYWNTKKRGESGINFLLDGGIDISLSKNTKLNIEIGYFNTDYSRAITPVSFNSGIVWMYK